MPVEKVAQGATVYDPGRTGAHSTMNWRRVKDTYRVRVLLHVGAM